MEMPIADTTNSIDLEDLAVCEPEVNMDCEAEMPLNSVQDEPRSGFCSTEYPTKSSFTCGMCGWKAKTEKSIVGHLKKHESNKFVCSICPLIFKTDEELKSHLFSHNKEVPYKCTYCKHGFFRLKSFQSHNCKKRPIICGYCGEKFSSKTRLKIHIRKEHRHQVTRQSYCPHCPFSSLSGASLNEHLLKNHVTKTLQCPHCTSQFSNVEALQAHIVTHKDETSFKCIYCGLAFAKYGVVKLHMEIHKDRSIYSCQHCGFESPSRRNIRIHVKREHLTEKNFKCPHCDYLTSVEKRLQKHLLVHQGNATKLHMCSSCDYRTRNKCDLKRHTQSFHSTEKKYSCPYCDYKCSSLCSLKHHASRHIQTLPPPDFLKI